MPYTKNQLIILGCLYIYKELSSEGIRQATGMDDILYDLTNLTTMQLVKFRYNPKDLQRSVVWRDRMLLYSLTEN